MCGGGNPRTSSMMSSAASAVSAMAASPTKPMADISYTLAQSLQSDYSQLKRDWAHLRMQNKVAVGAAASIGAVAIVVVIILAVMLARRR